MKTIKLLIPVLYFVFLLNGCSSLDIIPTKPASLAPITSTSKELRNLPLPKDKIVCAVYKFRDQTGQYKQVENGTSWSTAVTQGATSILTRALEDSKWFIPIEREGLSNLLNERKIINMSRSNYQTDSGSSLPPIPPLLYAGIILEGGIISYETNVITGGSGLKYFGTGASNEYRQDQVTIYLRAISTQNGRVLKTVYTSKTILSQMVDVGVFKFVDVKKVLEAETGYSYNEPPQVCVTAAIEKAVQSLIIEGVFEGLWNLKNNEDINSESFTKYTKEKEDVYNQDFMARELVKNEKISFGLNSGAFMYKGDFPDPITKGLIGFQVVYPLDDFAGYFNLSKGFLAAQKKFSTTLFIADIGLQYKFHSNRVMTPFLIAGGTLNYMTNLPGYFHKKNDWQSGLLFGAGVDYRLLKGISLNLILENHYMLNDKFDGIKQGRYNDYYWGLKAGINYLIF
ncbi:MAG TPA: CsgG/HfaB family protein [Ignavibacteriaceae bacterium]|nr:CsgG/HfaB family protein [Ignavibacteriaceae bacterium]